MQVTTFFVNERSPTSLPYCPKDEVLLKGSCAYCLYRSSFTLQCHAEDRAVNSNGLSAWQYCSVHHRAVANVLYIAALSYYITM